MMVLRAPEPRLEPPEEPLLPELPLLLEPPPLFVLVFVLVGLET